MNKKNSSVMTKKNSSIQDTNLFSARIFFSFIQRSPFYTLEVVEHNFIKL